MLLFKGSFLLHDSRSSLVNDEMQSADMCFSLATVTKSWTVITHEVSAVDVEIKVDPRGEVMNCGGELAGWGRKHVAGHFRVNAGLALTKSRRSMSTTPCVYKHQNTLFKESLLQSD